MMAKISKYSLVFDQSSQKVLSQQTAETKFESFMMSIFDLSNTCEIVPTENFEVFPQFFYFLYKLQNML